MKIEYIGFILGDVSVCWSNQDDFSGTFEVTCVKEAGKSARGEEEVLSPECAGNNGVTGQVIVG